MLMQTLCKKGMKMKKAVNTLNLYLPFLTFHDGTCCASWNFADIFIILHQIVMRLQSKLCQITLV